MTVDPMIAFRAENYRHNLIADHVSQHKNTKKIPLVLSFVLYHGTTPWKYDTDIRSLVDAPRHLVEKYAFRPFVLIDVN